jgi:hypothetical protein
MGDSLLNSMRFLHCGTCCEILSPSFYTRGKPKSTFCKTCPEREANEAAAEIVLRENLDMHPEYRGKRITAQGLRDT